MLRWSLHCIDIFMGLSQSNSKNEIDFLFLTDNICFVFFHHNISPALLFNHLQVPWFTIKKEPVCFQIIISIPFVPHCIEYQTVKHWFSCYLMQLYLLKVLEGGIPPPYTHPLMKQNPRKFFYSPIGSTINYPIKVHFIPNNVQIVCYNLTKESVLLSLDIP